MTYNRVLPRDLFNEAKLLKCMGQLALLVHDGMKWPLTLCHVPFEYERLQYRGFLIDQDDSCGGLFVVNLTVHLDDHVLTLKTNYNSKAPFPLSYHVEDETGDVFDDNGNLSDEFCRYLERLTGKTKGESR